MKSSKFVNLTPISGCFGGMSHFGHATPILINCSLNSYTEIYSYLLTGNGVIAAVKLSELLARNRGVYPPFVSVTVYMCNVCYVSINTDTRCIHLATSHTHTHTHIYIYIYNPTLLQNI